MKKHNAKELISKYLRGEATPEERILLERWFQKDLESNDYTPSQDRITNADQRMAANLQRHIGPQPAKTKTIPLWARIAAAASILLFLSFGAYFLLYKMTGSQQVAQIHDIPPGHNQATLTLANGRKIVLTKGLKGQLATQGATVIQANENNISYNAEKKPTQISYNTLATARGEQSPYPLVLADGTKVWLNAASNITFPTAFPGKERIVKITGEAYFEVAHNNKQSFKVESTGQVTEDIGTHFNIMAYADEPATKTTLIEGKVKVNEILLAPGQQTDGSHIQTVNTKRYTAWKSGDFYFEDDAIQTVMRQLSRWYNIEVSYEGNITKDGFNAQISRSKNISAILHILENTKGVHFKIEGRRVIVIE